MRLRAQHDSPAPKGDAKNLSMSVKCGLRHASLQRRLPSFHIPNQSCGIAPVAIGRTFVFQLSLQSRLDSDLEQLTALFWRERWGRWRRTEILVSLPFRSGDSRAVRSHRDVLDGNATLAITG